MQRGTIYWWEHFAVSKILLYNPRWRSSDVVQQRNESAVNNSGGAAAAYSEMYILWVRYSSRRNSSKRQHKVGATQTAVVRIYEYKTGGCRHKQHKLVFFTVLHTINS